MIKFFALILNKFFCDFSLEKQTIFTVVKFSPILSENYLANRTHLQEIQEQLRTQAKNDLSDVLSVSLTRLLKEHVAVWSSIWESGFYISRSLAPSVINGDVINRTMYYVLCSTPAPLYEINIDERKKEELQQNVFQIDQCYESHSTL